ncbi:hypothetical protein J1N35_000449 [Gossypium stocksii]|uniref:Uncharacterized protein n=1 Tax=Gossypium stocksii TaxID=47602 RepID=A0A9D3WHH4_9ROSI|nr:hypothetical protein J1N35_000449 [Gossypium stocksii]
MASLYVRSHRVDLVDIISQVRCRSVFPRLMEIVLTINVGYCSTFTTNPLFPSHPSATQRHASPSSCSHARGARNQPVLYGLSKGPSRNHGTWTQICEWDVEQGISL